MGVKMKALLKRSSIDKADEKNRLIRDDETNGRKYVCFFRREPKEEVVGGISKDKGSIRGLFRYATWLDVLLLTIGALASVVTGGGFPFLSIIFGGMTDSFLSAQTWFTPATSGVSSNASGGGSPVSTISRADFHAQIIKSTWLYILVGFAVMICAYIQFACWSLCCERQIYRLRREFFKAILRQEIAWFDERQSGELTAKLSDDLERIREGIGDKFGLLLQYVFQLVCGFVIAFVYSWKMSLVMLTIVPLMALSAGFTSKMISGSTRKEQAIYSNAAAVVEEALACIRTVIAFNGQKHELARFAKELAKGKKVGVMKSVYTSVGFASMFFFMFCTYALAFWYGSILILNGEIERGTVFIVLFSVMMGSFALGNGAPLVGSLAVSKGASASILSIIDSKPIIDPYSPSGKRLTNPRGRIEFKNVKFAYPTRSTIDVLGGLSFIVEPGQTVALVGPSGCGKSTVVSLLLRYYAFSSGQILIDGRDISEFNVRWLRNLIGVVSQEPILFDLTVEENIRYGNLDADLDQIIEAAKMSNAHTFISQLPNGYKTLVGERGAQMSGGQKQRIAIARALVRDPKILLLDEATSALDSESESLVQEALDKAQRGRTTIVIAHRLSTVRNADKIIVLKTGQIVEQGTHDNLMSSEGLYFDLVTAQSLNDVEPPDNQAISDLPEIQPIAPKRSVERSVSLVSQESPVAPSKKSVHLAESVKRRQSLLSPDSERDRLVAELKDENVTKSTLIDILKANRPEWPYVICGLLGALVRGFVMPSFAFFYAQMFDAYSKTGKALQDEANFWALMLVLLGVVMAISCLFSSYFFGKSGEALTMRLRLEAFKNLLRQSVGYFDDPSHSTGRLCTRLATDAPNIKSAVDFRLSTVLASIISMCAGIAIAFIYGWKLALLLIVLVPFIGLSGYLNIKLRQGGQLADTKLLEKSGKIASEGVENIRTVQALTREKTFYDSFCQHLLGPHKRAMAQTQLHSISYAFAQSLMFFLYAACFRFGGYLVEIGDMQPVNVFKVFFAITFSGMTVSWATAYFPDFIKARFSAALVFKMIREKSTIDNYSTGGLKLALDGNVDFKNIHFVYPMRQETTILRNFNLKINQGETVALVGPSGCGKSTSVCLLERFYDPIEGQVILGENDLKSLNLPHVRQQIALVSQEPVLFNCSILDNIVYGLENVPYTKVVDSAKLANIHSFILTLPEGYQTKVGEKGVMLSGGQKQRIAIARALVRDPKILILDEATSALDTESEKIVQEALDRARTGRTCLVIAHRLSTIQNSDKIVVIAQGKMVEQGTHAELIQKRGLYYLLTRKQNLLT